MKFLLFKKLFGQSSGKNKEIPHDVIACTRELCARYLGGVWNTISAEQLRMQPIMFVFFPILFYFTILVLKINMKWYWKNYNYYIMNN